MLVVSVAVAVLVAAVEGSAPKVSRSRYQEQKIKMDFPPTA